ncbi:MAG: hypothetical protein GWP08_19735 [Nitrospiraceae bacterium]|nr:hypothetical protein [Nitrospiraceae bacterium]
MRSFAILFVSLVLVVSCDTANEYQEVTATRTVTPSAPLATTGQSTDRFGLEFAAPHTHEHETAARFAWDTPPGWTELPVTSMRLANFRVANRPDTQCYLTVLPGSGGGVVANINRWRAQMALSESSAEAIDNLPTIPLLGQEAAYVEFDGTFSGMNDAVGSDGFKLIGAIVVTDETAVFVKMTGPAEVLEQHRDNFKDFCKSLREVSDDESEQIDIAAPYDASSVGENLRWVAPETWRREPDRAMRNVTFTAGENGEVECFVSVLRTHAGGMEANINRWRKQMGREALGPEAIAALPRLDVLGQDAPMLAIAGVDGSSNSDWMLLGVVCELPDRGIFVKMLGPEAEVERERDRFVEFCQSLYLAE